MLSLSISDEIAVTLAISITALTWRRARSRADRGPETLHIATEVCQVSSEKILYEIWSGILGIIRCNRSLKSDGMAASIHKIQAWCHGKNIVAVWSCS
jgi:hypothetical protein